ncbi:MAG: alpha-L-fucosidase [Planctomycetes bacterium]|nr:alpha-L-fucosidase [Planctomycetota bacterium]
MRSSAAFALVASSSLLAQSPVPIPDGAEPATIVARAADVRPSPRQLAWQRTGMNAFVHFGMNTFHDREWGDGTEDPGKFAPTDFDAAQWVAAFQAAGMQGLVLTCKHHDGFCLWPSATTAHDVAASPFRGGKGDVVAEVAAACKAAGMKFGVYLSPWDRNAKSFGTPAYHAVFLQQLRELCTNYGPLFEVWFDGAHCPADDPALFDWQAVFRLMRELQPEAVLAITGPDVRWVGNEAGKTRGEEWRVLPLAHPAPGPFETDRASWRALWALRERNQEPDLGGRAQLATARALAWWPAETDVSIRPGWFWHAHEDAAVKPLSTLLEYWYGAVGGNAVLLLNVPADRRGRIADADVAVLGDLGRVLGATFGRDLGAGGTRKAYAKVGEIYLPETTTVDVFDLGEDVASSGQRVERFRIEVLQNGGWRECARGSTIGLRRLLRTEPITGDGFRWWVEQGRGPVQMAHFRLFRRPTLLSPPTIARDRTGTVTLRATAGSVHYTVDGTPVSSSAPRYTGPFALPEGGTVRAGAFAGTGDQGLALGTTNEASATFGLAPATFRVVDCSSEQGGGERAAAAIDGDAGTHWHSRWSPDSPGPPHHLTVDLGRALDVHGFVYQPRASGSNGTVADYEFLVSPDATTWTPVASGTFGNIAANPVAQVVRLERPAAAVRFVRFVAKREVAGRAWASCAELSVLGR